MTSGNLEVGISPPSPFPSQDALAAKEQVEFSGKQSDLDSELRRSLKRWAFAIFVIMSVAFFLALLSLLCRIFLSNYLVEVLGAPGTGLMGWHVLVFLGVCIAVFAAIPLTISGALFKLIDGGNEEAKTELKMPLSELVKILAETVKALAVTKHG